MHLVYGAATDAGLVRQRNEDSYVAEAALGLFVVVDGMGGHVGGEVASRTVADGVLEFIRATASDPEKTWPFGLDPELSKPANRLQVAIQCANLKLADLVSADETLDGSGATISAALFLDDYIVVSNVGDCRAYLVRNGNVRQITKDHSFVAEQVALGLLDHEQARHHPLRHMVTRAVSGELAISVDTWEIRVKPGDRVLLCSDGVHSLIDEAELFALVADREGSLARICGALVDAAKRGGGTDNATAVLVEVSDTTQAGD